MEKIQYKDTLEQFIDFGLQTNKWNKQEGSVIATGEPESGKMTQERVLPVRRVSDYTDLRFFSLGPVYVHCGISFDILKDFAAKTGYDGPKLALKFTHQVLAPLNGDWEYTIEGIHKDAFSDLGRFISTQSAMRKPEKELWNMSYQDIVIPDPLAIEDRTMKDGDSMLPLRVVLPSGNKYSLVAIPGKYPVLLIQRPPLLDHIRQAMAIFQTTP